MTDVVDHPLGDQKLCQLGQAPCREGQVAILRMGQGDLLDRPALRQRELRWSATGVLRSQGIEPVSVEVVDDLSNRPSEVKAILAMAGTSMARADQSTIWALRHRTTDPEPRRTIPRSLFPSTLVRSRTCTRSATTKVCATWHFRWWTRPQRRWQSWPWLPRYAMHAASFNSHRRPVPSSPVYRIAMVRAPSALPDWTPCPSAWRRRSSLPIGPVACRRPLRTLATCRTRAR